MPSSVTYSAIFATILCATIFAAPFAPRPALTISSYNDNNRSHLIGNATLLADAPRINEPTTLVDRLFDGRILQVTFYNFGFAMEFSYCILALYRAIDDTEADFRRTHVPEMGPSEHVFFGGDEAPDKYKAVFSVTCREAMTWEMWARAVDKLLQLAHEWDNGPFWPGLRFEIDIVGAQGKELVGTANMTSLLMR